MRPSKHNIISRIAGSDDYFIVNILTQNADILRSEQYSSFLNNSISDRTEWVEKGYLIDEAEEKKLFHKKYLEFLDNRDSDEIQLFFAPSYTCNFSCSYCYQDQYQQMGKIPDDEIIAAFFNYISKAFVNSRKYITLFGGEPLLDNTAHKDFVRKFIDNANRNKLEMAVVTNGYNLGVYLPILKKASIREIQVTLDGVKEVHNSRRHLHNGEPTFERIVEGIDKALSEQFPVNLRTCRICHKKRLDKKSTFQNTIGQKL